jgi:hypothetical protein
VHAAISSTHASRHCARIVRELTVTAWADAVRERNATSVCRPMRLDITMILRERRTGWCKPHATTRRPRTLKCTGGLASPADRLPYNLVQFCVVMCGPSTWVAETYKSGSLDLKGCGEKFGTCGAMALCGPLERVRDHG